MLLRDRDQAYLGGRFDGIAFALMGSNIAAFDVDHCRDAASGALHAWAQQLVARCGSYVEITPSSEGIRSSVWEATGKSTANS